MIRSTIALCMLLFGCSTIAYKPISTNNLIDQENLINFTELHDKNFTSFTFQSFNSDRWNVEDNEGKKYYLDTGVSITILSSEFLKNREVVSTGEYSIVLPFTGVNPVSISGKIYLVNKFSWGESIVNKFYFFVPDIELSEIGISQDIDGIIGMNLLKNYNISFDPDSGSTTFSSTPKYYENTEKLFYGALSVNKRISKTLSPIIFVSDTHSPRGTKVPMILDTGYKDFSLATPVAEGINSQLYSYANIDPNINAELNLGRNFVTYAIFGISEGLNIGEYHLPNILGQYGNYNYSIVGWELIRKSGFSLNFPEGTFSIQSFGEKKSQFSSSLPKIFITKRTQNGDEYIITTLEKNMYMSNPDLLGSIVKSINSRSPRIFEGQDQWLIKNEVILEVETKKGTLKKVASITTKVVIFNSSKN